MFGDCVLKLLFPPPLLSGTSVTEKFSVLQCFPQMVAFLPASESRVDVKNVRLTVGQPFQRMADFFSLLFTSP